MMKKSSDFTMCVKIARDTFDTNFDHSIRDLLAIFPKDHLDSHGMPFWSGPKRAPDAVSFDAGDELHIGYVESMANLIAFNLGLEQVRTRESIHSMVKAYPGKPYVAKAIKVETPEEEKAREARNEPPPTLTANGLDDE